MNSLELNIALTAASNFKLNLECAIPGTGVTAIYGPSGSGKTTLLNCIAGLQRADNNSTVRYRQQHWQSGENFVPAWERNIGFVFQDARLFPHLNVLQNLEYAYQRGSKNKQFQIDEVCHGLDLNPLLTQQASQLSAGQTQRVAIARALLCSPEMLLLDDPLANLDHATRAKCLGYLQKIKNQNLPMLYVSHSMDEVYQLADNLILVKDGVIEAQGPLMDLCSRMDTSMSHDEQAAAILLGTLKQQDKEFGLSELDVEGHSVYVNHLDQPRGAEYRLRIPARDISVCREPAISSSILNTLPVTLLEIEQAQSTRILLRLALGNQVLLARITRKSAVTLNLTVGETLFAQIKSVALLGDTNGSTD